MADESDEATSDTTIRIKVDTWQRLNERKNRPNHSFDDVINELLDEVEAGNGTPATRATAD